MSPIPNAQLAAMLDEALQNRRPDAGRPRLQSVEVRLVGDMPDDELKTLVDDVTGREDSPERLTFFAKHPMSAAVVERNDGATMLHLTVAAGAPAEDIDSLVENLGLLHETYENLLIRVTDLDERLER